MPCYDLRGIVDKDGLATVRPCGQCLGCRLDRTQDYAVRLTLESQMYSENCFITLTYNDESLPEDKSVQKDILTGFVKDLRNHITNNSMFGCEPRSIKFFGCGEYGECCKNCGLSRPYCVKEGCRRFVPGLGRPHYHVILLNYDFSDKELFHGSKRTAFTKSGLQFVRRGKGHHDIFVSKTLSDIWGKGFTTIQGVGYESAAYVARYVCKKINGEPSKEHYQGRNPEFACMSRGNRCNPYGGLGKVWFEKYYRDVYPKDYLTIEGIRFRPPLYFDKLMEKLDPIEMRQIRRKRRNANLEKYPESTFRQHQREMYRERVTKRLERRSM